MNTVKSHLRSMHEASAEHHTRLAKCHDKIAKCFSKMADAGGDNADAFGELAEHHQKVMDAHASAAEGAIANCKTLDESAKAMGIADDFEKRQVEPDKISGILTSFPPLRAIPRAGAPTDLVDTTGLDPRLADLVKVEHAE